MSNLIPGNLKHLSLQDRLYIEQELSAGFSFKDIARFLCKDLSTISKEVKKHRFSDWNLFFQVSQNTKFLKFKVEINFSL